MRRAFVALVLLLALVTPVHADSYKAAINITSQTTTTIVAAVTGQRILIFYGALCVDANGATTGIKLQDSAGTNILGTNVVFVVAPGECLKFDALPALVPYPYVTAVSTSLQVVTTVGNGPVNGTLVGVQR